MIGRTLLPALALALLAGCGYDATPPERAPDPAAAGAAPAAPAESTPAPAAQPLLVREDPGHLADASGAALYFLEGNRDGRRCDDACEQVWPPVTLASGGQPVAGPGVQQAAVGVASSQAGDGHVTYHGHPLYRYAGDRGARTTTGHDVRDEWGHWMLMGIDGSAATPSAAADATDQQSTPRQQNDAPEQNDAPRQDGPPQG